MPRDRSAIQSGKGNTTHLGQEDPFLNQGISCWYPVIPIGIQSSDRRHLDIKLTST